MTNLDHDAASSPASLQPIVNQTSFVTLHYRIRLAQNQQVVVSTFEEKPATLSMGAGQLSEGLERCLLGMQVGMREVFNVSAQEGYGVVNPELYRPVSKKLLFTYGQEDTKFEPGEFVHFPTPQGGQFAGKVVQEREDDILFDFNHPLAGKALIFEVQLIGVL